MTRPTPEPTDTPTGPAAEQQALQAALAGLLAPVARLAVARGLPFAAVEEMLKLAFVQAADAAHPGLLAHRKVSRISTTTGINRREVTRLTQQAPRTAAHSRTLASEVFAHWLSAPAYRDRRGGPRVLPRQGPAPSFETLAQTITRDVHPRSLLDEMLRLSLASWDEAEDRVTLADFAVPRGDDARMLGLLGDNVGDHLRAAVDNVLGDSPSHFEQAVFASGLSDASLAALRPLLKPHWQALLNALVPVLEAQVEADALQQPAPRGRVRIGLYSYQLTDAEAAAEAPADTPADTPAEATARPAKAVQAAPDQPKPRQSRASARPGPRKT